MFVLTFYSFKGGVGRTMSIANVAASLCERGKKVLVVDFDLEAPSLTSYDIFAEADGSPGVVDFISKFLSEERAPAAADYIVRCDGAYPNLYAMTAGEHASNYRSRLQEIDWLELYEHRNGYLLMEDLRQQWAELGFDYVLLDSRTGHTDVGGICTRQLPDAVIAMFAPNKQNIAGLATVVSEIRDSGSIARGRAVEVLFCAANVPELDDEKGILFFIFKEAQRQLKYSEISATIHHYPSLEILSQSTFVKSRPNSRLAKEYRKLAEIVTSLNLEDRDGALIRLSRIHRDIQNGSRRRGSKDGGLPTHIDTLVSIREAHPHDPEIAFNLGRIYLALGYIEAEIAAWEVAIEGKFSTHEALRRRASALLKLGKKDEAIHDLEDILRSKDAPAPDVLSAVEMFRLSDADWVNATGLSSAVRELDPSVKLLIVESLQATVEGHDFGASLAREVLSDPRSSNETKSWAKNDLMLSLIGAGRFYDAIDAADADRSSILGGTTPLNVVFNYAMAQWAIDRAPPMDLFEQVLRQADVDRNIGPNKAQCFALSAFAIGRKEKGVEYADLARNLPAAVGRVFTCWRYLYVTSGDFISDVEEMERGALIGELIPPALRIPGTLVWS